MSYKCEEELREKATAFVTALADAGIAAEIVPGSARDFLIKVSLSRAGRLYGHVNLNYSPTKRHFSLKPHELRDKAILPDVEACWEKLMTAGQEPEASPATHLGIAAYVDGSWLAEAIGYGVVILQDGLPISELSGRVDDETLQGMRQVGGELQAVYAAVKWCRENGVQQVSVYYDYDGIEKWATGDWQAKSHATQAYAEAIRNCGVSVYWHKVAAHSGDRWNQRADQLAKSGASKRTTEGESPADPRVRLESHATALVRALAEQGIAASYHGMINNQAARVVLTGARGAIDLYDTRNRPLSRPYLHDFSDKALEARVEALWQAHLSGGEQVEGPDADPLAEVTYYYRILEPYRDCAFDFHNLAAALDRAYREVKGTGVDTESSRYDFRTLEALYFDLKGG